MDFFGELSFILYLGKKGICVKVLVEDVFLIIVLWVDVIKNGFEEFKY